MKKFDTLSLLDPFREMPPKKLYKYTSSKRALEILINNEIYFAKPSEFNDPFDGRFMPDLATPESRKNFMENREKEIAYHGGPTPIDWKYKKQRIINDKKCADEYAKNCIMQYQENDNTGFCCLSSTCDSLPMWAHYSENHAGCCFIFDLTNHRIKNKNKEIDIKRLPFIFVSKINYVKRPPKDNIRKTYNKYLYKSCAWEYEKEWRAVMYDGEILDSKSNDIVAYLAQKTKGSGLYKLDDNVLSGIILGHKMKMDEEKSIVRISRQRGIKIYETSPKLYEYSLDIKEI